MFELIPKVNPEARVEINTITMALMRTVMFHAGVPIHLIERFETNNTSVIGEKAGKLIADKLQEALEALSSGVSVERRVVEGNQVTMKIAPLTVKDLLLIAGFIGFNRAGSPYEIH